MKPIRYFANEKGHFEGLPEGAAKDGLVTFETFTAQVRENRKLRKRLKKSSPLKLFMVRLESGNSVIMQALDREEAIEHTGLNVRAENATTLGTDGRRTPAVTTPEDIAALQASILRNDLGPQNYSIRELKNFCCRIELTDDGRFDTEIDGEFACREFSRDYPEVDKADDDAFELSMREGWKMEPVTAETRIPRRIPSQGELALRAEGVRKERARLAGSK